MGPPMLRVHPPVNELSQSSLANDVRSHALDKRRQEMPGPTDVAPPGDVDFMQLSKIRGAANGKVKTSRGRNKSAYIGALRECHCKAG